MNACVFAEYSQCGNFRTKKINRRPNNMICCYWFFCHHRVRMFDSSDLVGGKFHDLLRLFCFSEISITRSKKQVKNYFKSLICNRKKPVSRLLFVKHESLVPTCLVLSVNHIYHVSGSYRNFRVHSSTRQDENTMQLFWTPT